MPIIAPNLLNNLRNLGLFMVALMMPTGLHARSPASDSLIVKLASRLFPELSTVKMDRASARLTTLVEQREQRIAECNKRVECELAASAWPQNEIDLAAAEISQATDDDRSANNVTAQVQRELSGINEILLVYGGAKPPLYPAIDGPDGVGSALFKQSLETAAVLAETNHASARAPFDHSIDLALSLLDVADRLDAIALEPLKDTENHAALHRSKSIRWSKYPYTAIIAPGVGPEEAWMPLSPRGKLNVRLAADSYFAGQAPFIIVSGAGVHPRHTEFVEAIEMKRQLISRFSIPPDAIVVEPYARHTTTNLRNAARLLVALKAPQGQKALITTNPEQSSNIESTMFRERNLREIGYMSGVIGKRLSPNIIEFLPMTHSFPIDPKDPLDP